MLPVKFPSSVESLRRQLVDEQDLTPDERVQAVCDLLATASAMNPAEDVFGSQDPLWLRREAEWQRCMRELFQRQRVAAEADRV